MLKNAKLVELQGDLERGAILRCKGVYPYENYVDFLVMEYCESTKRHYAMIVISGYKAGLIYVVFPEESIPQENAGYAVDIKWLQDNWSKWGYVDCPLEEVYLIRRISPRDFDDY